MAMGSTTTLVAMMLGAALVGGSVAERLRLPRIVGWILAGLALKWVLTVLEAAGLGAAGEVARGSREALYFIKQLALTGVMLSIGMVFELHHVRRLGRAFLWVGLAQAAGAAVLTFAACGLVGYLTGADKPFMAATFFAAVAMAISPAATLLTLRQYGAKGHTTDEILTITGLSAIVSIMLFDLSLLVFVEVGWVHPPGGTAGMHLAVLKLVSATAGSIVVGILAGLVLSLLHARSSPAQKAVFPLALMLAILVLSRHLNLDYLLMSLLAGVTFINLAPDPGRLEQHLSVVGAPLFALLFAIAGFNLRFSIFASPGGALVAAYVLARSAGKIAGSYLAASRLKVAETRTGIGLGLLCHAGVAFGLVTSLEALWPAGEAPAWVDHLYSVILGSIAVFELAGPLLLKRAIVSAGEVKAFRLFHFPAPVTGAWGQIRDGAMSLFRRLGLLPLPRTHNGPLCARHVMHTNAKLLPANADLDEVLRFIERSRLDHFPVVDGRRKFVGTISLADVRDIIYQPDTQNLVTAQDLLEDNLVTASPAETLAELFDKFRAHKARDLVILDGDSGEVLGVVEQRDVLRAMHVEQTGRTPPAGH